MGLKSPQSLYHLVPYLPSSSSHERLAVSAVSYSLFSYQRGYNQSHGIFHLQSSLGSCCNLRRFCFKRSCNASDYDNFDEECSNQIEYLAQNFDHMDDDNDNQSDKTASPAEPEGGSDASTGSYLPSKIEFLEPDSLGIEPEPPDWPERDEIVRISIEWKANSVEIPLSLRMIKRKQKWEEGFADAGDFACCSVKRAFSSMVFIIRELQGYALHARESVHREDLKVVMKKVQMEMNASFVWLFQQIFSGTPTLMVHVMLLLANFTVHSMVGNNVLAASPSPTVIDHGTVAGIMLMDTEETAQGQGQVGQISSGSKNGDWVLGKLSTSNRHPEIVSDQLVENSLPGNGNQEVSTEEEAGQWNSMAEEALRMEGESRCEVIDYKALQESGKTVSVELEPDDYVEYYRTDLGYQMGVAEDPKNSLLLLNYAQFLHLVYHDHDRAEECFKRAITGEPLDAEALSRYGDFLWMVRKELWSAEEQYLQAMAVEPNNTYYASKYANFLWTTGGKDTSFPLGSLK